MQTYLTPMLMIAVGLAIALLLARVFRKHFTTETNRLIACIAIVGLVGQSAIVLTASALMQSGTEAIQQQIQDIQARTVLFEKRVTAQKIDVQTLGARPNAPGSDADKTWLERRANLDQDARVTSASIDKLVKDTAALKKTQAELAHEREQIQTKMFVGLGLILAGLFLGGLYRNSQRPRDA